MEKKDDSDMKRGTINLNLEDPFSVLIQPFPENFALEQKS